MHPAVHHRCRKESIMAENIEKVASLKEVMDYFRNSGDSSKSFAAEWKALTLEEKTYFKEAVGGVISQA